MCQLGVLTKPADTLLAAAQVLGVEKPKRLSTQTGIKSSSATDMQPKEQRTISVTIAKCFKKLVELPLFNGKSDPTGVVNIIRKRGDLGSLFADPTTSVNSSEELGRLRALRSNLVSAFQIYSKQKNKHISRALLSLVAGTQPLKETMEIFSEAVSLRVGTLVYFTNKKEKDVTSKTEGIITAVRHDAGTCDIRVCERNSGLEKMRFQTSLEEADVLVTGMSQTQKTITDLRIGSLHEVGKVNVTEWQVKNALLLAEEGFPGEFVLESHQKKVRIRKSNLHHLTMATHLDSEELFPIRHSSSKGAEYFRSLSMRGSYELACRGCKDARCELPRWEDYLHVLSSSQYTPQTALNCVCTWCRIFGLETFDEAVENVRFIAMPDELKEEFVERLNRTRKFICVTYAGRLKEESSNAWYCHKFALTTANFEPFHEDCAHSHDGEDKKREQVPTMDQLAQRKLIDGGHDRNALVKDWDDECFNCGGSGKQAILCNNCPKVSCRECIERTQDDISQSISKKPDEDEPRGVSNNGGPGKGGG